MSTKANASLIENGVLIAARAVIDMLATFERVIAHAYDEPAVRLKQAAIADAEAAITQPLRSLIRAIEEAATDGIRADDRHTKIGNAISRARELVDNIGLFTAVSEAIGERVLRISEALPTKGRKPPPLQISFATELASLSARLEIVIDASPAPAMPQWCREMIGDLSRLENASPQARLAALGRVRADLVYKLVVTRRLDRVFEALLWMAAPSGAFRLTFGGPLGAMAAMFEVARHREIAVELVARTYEPASGARLDTIHGKQVYATPAKVQAGLASNSRAGFWLATSALSHHMVKAFLAGLTFDSAHSLPTLQAGQLGWRFEQSMRDPATMAAVTTTELGKSIYATADYHRDLPRYMGLTVDDVLTAAIVDIFPGEFRDPGHNKFVATADKRRKTVGIGSNPFRGDYARAADRELVRSILKSLDMPSDGNDSDWRSGSVVTRGSGTDELRRFDDRNVGHVGDRGDAGGRIRPRAARIRRAQKDPGRNLRRMVDRARSWTDDSDDRLLAGVLSGCPLRTPLVPVAQTGIPAIWFRPAIGIAYRDDREAETPSFWDLAGGWAARTADNMFKTDTELARAIGIDKGTLSRGLAFRKAPDLMGDDWVEIGAAWQAMEDASTRANAKIQILAIAPFDSDMSDAEMIAALGHFCKTVLGPLGLPYSAAIHAPSEHGDQRNFHPHIAFSLRPMRRIERYCWEVADDVCDDLDGRDGVQALRHLWAHSMSAAAEEARSNRRYTGLGYGARGLDLEAGEHLGEARSAMRSPTGPALPARRLTTSRPVAPSGRFHRAPAPKSVVAFRASEQSRAALPFAAAETSIPARTRSTATSGRSRTERFAHKPVMIATNDNAAHLLFGALAFARAARTRRRQRTVPGDLRIDTLPMLGDLPTLDALPDLDRLAVEAGSVTMTVDPLSVEDRGRLDRLSALDPYVALYDGEAGRVETDYPALKTIGVGWDWFDAPGVQQFLADRGGIVALVGEEGVSGRRPCASAGGSPGRRAPIRASGRRRALVPARRIWRGAWW